MTLTTIPHRIVFINELNPYRMLEMGRCGLTAIELTVHPCHNGLKVNHQLQVKYDLQHYSNKTASYMYKNTKMTKVQTKKTTVLSLFVN